MSWKDWVRTVEVEPSLYAADFSRLGEQIETLARAGVRVFHFDVGDGHFVPPITIGPIVLSRLPRSSTASAPSSTAISWSRTRSSTSRPWQRRAATA